MIPVNTNKLQVICETLKAKPEKNSGFNDLVLKGKRKGYDFTLTVFKPFFPFGTGYLINFNMPDETQEPYLKLTVLPRFAKGLMSIFGRLILFESKGQTVKDGKFERRFITTYNDMDLALAFLENPGVKKLIWDLSMSEEFNELVINSNSGIYLYQPQSFNYLAVEKCEKTLDTMVKLAEAVTEVFYE